MGLNEEKGQVEEGENMREGEGSPRLVCDDLAGGGWKYVGCKGFGNAVL